MRTTLEIDDALMNALLERHPGASKREAVEEAIRSHLAQGTVERIVALRGQVAVEDLSVPLRRDRAGAGPR